MQKQRLDVLMVERGLAQSRERAKALILSRQVLCNGKIAEKAGDMYLAEDEIVLKEPDCPYVSRGGFKLEKAIHTFSLNLRGKVCMDVGASTGGFTDCLLQQGASKVFAIDVGYGQLAWKIRNDPRVVVMERTNIRYVTPEDFTVELYRKVAELLYEQHAKGELNPAQIMNYFTEEEEHRAVAALFNTRIKELTTAGEQEKAIKETILRVKEYSIETATRNLDPTDIQGLQRLMNAKKAVQDLHKLHISIN